MSKVLWVFIQSFKIRGKEKKNHTVLLNVFHTVFWFVFFVLGTQNGALSEQFTDFRMGKEKGPIISRLPRSTAELKD